MATKKGVQTPMNKNEVFRKSHQGSINDLVLAKEVKNPVEYFNFDESFDLTPNYSELCELYGNEIADKCYYFLGLFPEVVYFDKDNYVIFKLTSAILSHTPKEKVQQLINHIMADIKEYGLESPKVFIGVPSEFQMSLIDYYLTNNDIKDYKSFIELYTYNEYNFSQLSKDKLHTIFGSPHEKIGQDIIDSLPRTVTIYRGEGDASTPTKKAMSWSLSRDIAAFFACKNSDEKATIIEAKVRREHILDIINERDEEEVLVYPENVKIVKRTKLPSIDDISNKYAQEFVNVQFVFETLMEKYINDIKDKTRSSHDHNFEHLQRVCILSGLIHEISRKKYSVLNDKSLIDVMTAAIWHDIARENDNEDNEHGKRAAEFLSKSDFPFINERILQIVEYHCLDDSQFPVTDKVTKLLYQILKDADALDRVRFGIKALDTSYLRLGISKTLIFFAHQMLSSILYIEK